MKSAEIDILEAGDCLRTGKLFNALPSLKKMLKDKKFTAKADNLLGVLVNQIYDTHASYQDTCDLKSLRAVLKALQIMQEPHPNQAQADLVDRIDAILNRDKQKFLQLFRDALSPE